MLLLILFLGLCALVALGLPIAFAIGIAAMLAILWQGELSLMMVSSRILAGLDSFPLMAVPFFLLAGELMSVGGISRRLVQFVMALVGRVRAGLAIVMVMASMIFAGISGSASADAAAIGSLMVPAMLERGYPRGFVATLQGCAATMGPIIPPSILMIIYGSIAQMSIGKLFTAGFLPGVLIGVALMVASFAYGTRAGFRGEAAATGTEVLRTMRDALPALVMPAIIIGGILSGVFTATEAGAVSVAYALAVGGLVYREFTRGNLALAFRRAALTSAMLMYIVAMSQVFSLILARERMPVLAVDFVLGISRDPRVVMFLVVVFLLILTMFVEGLSAVIILVPILHPFSAQVGFDPTHFAIVVIVAVLIGTLTPPVAVLLYLTCGLAGCTLQDTFRYLPWFLLIMIACLFVVAYVPALSLALPRLVGQ